MPLQFYKPRATGKGCAAGFSFNSKDGKLYINLIQQSGWNAAKKVGVFKGGTTAVVSFSLTEIGGFKRAIAQKTEFKTFHSTPKGAAAISFGPYELDGAKKGYAFKVYLTPKKGEKLGFSIGFTFDELYLLNDYLSFVLEHCFSAIYSADKKKNDEYFKQKNKKSDDTEEEPDDLPDDSENAEQNDEPSDSEEECEDDILA